MGVSLPGGGGGGGRGRNVNAELNLVPFIDLLCSTITFLLATAVWSQTEVLSVDQAVRSDDIVDYFGPPLPPPMTVHVRADGVWVGRLVETGQNLPLVAGEPDWIGLDAALRADHDAYPEQDMVVIVTDDGVPYERMVRALDLSRAHGYDKTLLGGGPASNNAASPPTGG